MALTSVLRWGFVGLIPLALVIACGGATAQDVEGSAVDAGVDNATSTGTGDSSTAVKDSSATTDGSVGPTPKSVTCGGDECARSGDGKSREICCVKPGSPPEMACTPELDRDACKEGRRECDDATDCAPGQVCCAETTSGRMSTICMATCITGAPRWQVCKTSAECEGGIPCTTGICPKQGVYGFCVGAAIPDGCR